LSLQLLHVRSISSTAISDAAENSTLVLELKHLLHLAKAAQVRAEEDEASARMLHAAELVRTEQLENANQALVSQVHIASLEAASARLNAAKEKSSLLERLALAEDGMIEWKLQYDELSLQLNNSGRLRLLQERISVIEHKTT
jgi:hypothetical protein